MEFAARTCSPASGVTPESKPPVTLGPFRSIETFASPLRHSTKVHDERRPDRVLIQRNGGTEEEKWTQLEYSRSFRA
jgi:hypothetical protein